LTAAQKRIADGSYGTCIDCDEPIDDDRLKVQPAALRCLDCQELLERRNFVPG
jgi:RNA polymerase-binding transcription factor DksA